MIIGKGLVAKGFHEYEHNEQILIFASGVSDSSTLDSAAFKREQNLLEQTMQQHPKKLLIYFSTCSVYDTSLAHAAYVHHKLHMESIVSEHPAGYLVFRVSNLAGYTGNSHTLLNHIYNHIITGQLFYIWKYAERNIIDIDDTVKICSKLIAEKKYRNTIINIASPNNHRILQIVNLFEAITGKKANFKIIEKGGGPAIDTCLVRDLASALNISFDQDYLLRVVKKYYQR